MTNEEISELTGLCPMAINLLKYKKFDEFNRNFILSISHIQLRKLLEIH